MMAEREGKKRRFTKKNKITEQIGERCTIKNKKTNMVYCAGEIIVLVPGHELDINIQSYCMREMMKKY